MLAETISRHGAALARLTSVLGLILLWEGAGRLAESRLLPSASTVVAALWREAQSGALAANLGATLARVAAAFAAAMLLGSLLGLGMGAWRRLDLLLDELEQLAAEGRRALVFSQFTSFLRMVSDALDERGVGYEYLDGSTRKRPEVIERFRQGTAPAFLISLKAGGFGLTLTEADTVFVLDPWWNPAAESQAVDRTHRRYRRDLVPLSQAVELFGRESPGPGQR